MTTFEKIQKAAIARLEAGEPVHIILQDYADYETELRPILEAKTGKQVSATAFKPKRKNQTSQQSMMPLLFGALSVLGLFLVAAFFFLGTSQVIVEPYTGDTTCVGVPAPQITSAFALQQQNNPFSNVDISFGSGGASRSESSVELESVAMDDVASSPTSPPFESDSSGAGASDLAFANTADEASADYDSYDDADYSEEEIELESVDLELAEADALDSASFAPERQQVQEPLRAGEINDNVDWDNYQEYRNNFLNDYGTNQVRNVDTTDRQIIRVVDREGNPVLGACVQIYNGQTFVTSSLTYATGLTLFFPNLNDSTRYVDTFDVVVTYNDITTEGELDRESIGGVTEFELDTVSNAQQGTIEIDVMFLLDATGSMADEIEQLQDNILMISEQINALEGDIDVRYGLVSYRDRGEQYVTRVHDFTSSVSEFQELLLDVRASGGGDYPESLNQGLDMALNAVEWRGQDAIQLVFLVADAPPHIDYDNDADYSLLMQSALARGVKIHPIGSSGLQPEGEFILRQIAQYTMGRFIFLTYEDGTSGSAGDERTDLEVGTPEDEQGVGDYSVSQLDELVLNLITEEINALQGE